MVDNPCHCRRLKRPGLGKIPGVGNENPLVSLPGDPHREPGGPQSIGHRRVKLSDFSMQANTDSCRNLKMFLFSCPTHYSW